MNWISIEDKLPTLNEPVLFCCYGFGHVELGWYEGHKTRGDAIRMETRIGDPWWWFPCTHWMPLPETPEALRSKDALQELADEAQELNMGY